MTEDWQRTIDPERTAVFLDVDGTLLGFKDRPEDVVADPALLDLLRCLLARTDGATALVSGRAITDIDRIVAPLVLPAGGVHGADLRFADGRRETMDAEALSAVREKTRAFVSDTDGLRLEDKGATLAVHFRAAPAREDEVLRFLEDVIADHDLMIQRGKMVAEVKSGHSHKGQAIERLMRSSPFAGRSPLFIGDDLTDEHGFETVTALSGTAVKVGAPGESSSAEYRLADVAAVRTFLKVMCRRS